MTAILKSLQTITTGYTSFEKDQVLTHDQLNTLAAYADDQIRLTRVKAIGVGIASGLVVEGLIGGPVDGLVLSPGVGITTDGDLVHIDAARRHDRFKPYDRQGPAYAPFERVVGGTPERITAFECVPVGVEDARAVSFAEFPGGRDAMQRSTAVLYVESCLLDGDLCSGTNCDNMGQQVTHVTKLLLVDRDDAERLRDTIVVPHAAYGGLPELAVARVVPRAEWTQLSSLVDAFRAAIRTAHNDLLAAFDRLEQTALPVPGTFPASPIADWRAALQRLDAQQQTSGLDVQYHYDLLRDLAETWNAAREALFDDREWLHDDVEQFSKHLLLGDIADPAQHRVGWFPSPALRLRHQSRLHHQALLQKFDRLLARFDAGLARDKPVRVTPSPFAERPLEDRAIPAYYRTDAAFATAWSHHHAARGSHDRVPGYHAANYSQRPEVLEPNGAQLACCPFFRIEGHVGKPVAAAVREIQEQIRRWNLPFAVEAVMLASEGRIVVKPPFRFTDLDRLHAVIRHDLVNQLDDVLAFTGSLRTELQAAVDGKRIDDLSPGTGVALTQLAAQEEAKLVETTNAIRPRITADYATYRAEPGWKENVREALQSAARLKQDQGAVGKTHFATPVDTLISSTHHGWLELLDDLRDARDQAAEERLRFGAFLAAHPGADHQAGVTRGGTFLLVYGSDGRVAADFMLPYLCCAPEVDEEPPVKKPPTIRPEWIKKHGLKVLPQLDKEIGTRLQQFEARFKPEIVERIKVQEEYFKLFQTGGRSPATGGLTVNPGTDFLGLLAQDAAIKRAMLEFVKAEPNAPAERITAAETALATSLESVVKHMAASNTEVAIGTEGFRRVEELSSHLAVLSAERRTSTGRTIAAVPTGNTALRRVLETFRRE
jgi:hypothetical protein